MLATIVMTILVFILFMFFIIIFIVYFDYIPSIVGLSSYHAYVRIALTLKIHGWVVGLV